MKLTEFLAGRISEDEAAAAEMRKRRDINGLPCPRCGERITAYGSKFGPPAVVNVHHRVSRSECALTLEQWHELSDGGPTDEGKRLLAECEAKRRMIEDLSRYCFKDLCHNGTCARVGCRNLRRLALPYSDHPDCRQKWKP